MKHKIGLVCVVLVLICIASIVSYDTTKVTENAIAKYEDNLNDVTNIALQYSKLENTLYTKATISNLNTIEKMCTPQFFQEHYTEVEQAIGLPDKLVDYSDYIQSVVVQKKADTFEVMLYGIEKFGTIEYPYTVIVTLTKDKLVSSYQKLSHLNI